MEAAGAAVAVAPGGRSQTSGAVVSRAAVQRQWLEPQPVSNSACGVLRPSSLQKYLCDHRWRPRSRPGSMRAAP